MVWAAWRAQLGDECEAKQVELDKKIHEISPGYFEAKQAAKAKYEAELEALAAQAKLEREGEGADQVEDHDRRKLKAAKRLKTANAQKKEGNELFSGKNYKQATVRSVTAFLWENTRAMESHLRSVMFCRPFSAYTDHVTNRI